MSSAYYYMNDVKRQYFEIGLFGTSCRHAHAGFGFGSRALSLLISQRGTWNRDSVEMINGDFDERVSIAAGYIDVSVEAELVVMDVDGVDVFEEWIEANFIMLDTLCHYAMIFRRSDVLELLDRLYGRDLWTKKHKERTVHSTAVALHEAQNRTVVLYDP